MRTSASIPTTTPCRPGIPLAPTRPCPAVRSSPVKVSERRRLGLPNDLTTNRAPTPSPATTPELSGWADGRVGGMMRLRRSGTGQSSVMSVGNVIVVVVGVVAVAAFLLWLLLRRHDPARAGAPAAAAR